jgi:hypothetical protein
MKFILALARETWGIIFKAFPSENAFLGAILLSCYLSEMSVSGESKTPSSVTPSVCHLPPAPKGVPLRFKGKAFLGSIFGVIQV